MHKSNLPSNKLGRNATQTQTPPEPVMPPELVQLHLMTQCFKESDALENLNLLYTTYCLSDEGIDDRFEDKAIMARFFLFTADLIKFNYAQFSE